MRRGNLYPIMAPEVRPADPELRHTMLGMTEAGSVITISEDESDQPEHRRGSFGKPAPGFETIDRRRELCIRGPYVMQRYYKRSREECFDADGWFHTGDLVRTDADGFVYFIGRRGAMIKTAGANVAPAEVERAIAKVTGGTVAHVLGLPDPERGQLVAAVVALEDGASSTRPRSVIGSKPSCLPTRSRNGLLPFRVRTFPCSPAERSTSPCCKRCSMPDTSTGWSGSAPSSTGTSLWSSTRSRGSATPSSTNHPRAGRRVHRSRRRQGDAGRSDHAEPRAVGTDRDGADAHRCGAGPAEHPCCSRRSWWRSYAPRPCRF